MIRRIARDLVELAYAAKGNRSAKSVAGVLVLDAFPVLAMTRVRETARQWHIPGVNRALRLVQMTIYGIEIGKDVTVGPGVYAVHSLGTVIGGTARLGARVRLMGSNTIGTAKDNGYPVIEDDVVVGCGARILGPVRVGARAVIGANAVVISDIPDDAVAMGVPAVVRGSVKGSSGPVLVRQRATAA